MYGKAKNNSVPSDNQARERLATYVYEYLLHVGANKAAHTFLQEIGWDKSISVGEPPGFLHSWWCVFWDLYCASPEKRDTSEHSTEAKAFHDYSSSSASSINPMGPDGMVQPGIHPGYFPRESNSNVLGNSIVKEQFMSQRYPHGGPRPTMQGPGGPPSMLQAMDHPRQGQMMSMNRMVHPRGIPSASMNPYPEDRYQHVRLQGGMRMPTSTMQGHGGIPMQPMHTRSPWPNQSLPSGPASVGQPATPMMRSPQDQMTPDYVHMKQMQQPPLTSSFPMGAVGPDNLPPSTLSAAQAQGMPVSTPNMTPGLNGMNGTGPDPGILDGLPKTSPVNNIAMNSIGPGGPTVMVPPGGPGGTPHTPQESEGDTFNMAFNDNVSSNAPMASY